MPELPEVETIKRSLVDKIVGRTIKKCSVSQDIYYKHSIGRKPLFKKQSIDEFIDLILNSTILSVERRAKYLIFSLKKENQPLIFVSHLKMSGSWHVVDSLKEIEEVKRKHAHIIFTLSDNKLFVYCDIRKFGEANVFTTESFSKYKSVQELGPEPFDSDAKKIFIQNSLSKSYVSKPIKFVLMRPDVIAGIGNIYACESLFEAKIHPLTKPNQLSEKELGGLFNFLVDMLLYSISVGGASISDYVDAEGKRGSFQNTMKVYQQKTCSTCGHSIEKVLIDNRSTFYCPSCQPVKK